MARAHHHAHLSSTRRFFFSGVAALVVTIVISACAPGTDTIDAPGESASIAEPGTAERAAEAGIDPVLPVSEPTSDAVQPNGEREQSPKTHKAGPVAPDDPDWLPGHVATQRSSVEASPVRADFRLTDALPESGITWRHRTTPDGAIAFKANHYDHGNGVSTADIDGDGLQDLYFITQIGSNALYRNVGDGRFEDVTDEGLALDSVVCVTASFADIDNDGDPDLYVTTLKEGNRLFLNDGAGGFTDVSEGSGVDYVGHSSAADFFDYDQDGLLDLFLSVVGVYTAREQGPAALDTNDVEDPRAYSYYIGLEDAFSGHMYGDRTEGSRLYRNTGNGRFEDVTAAMGFADERGWSGDAVPMDVNRDGWTDLYVLNMQGNDEYYENQQGRGFVSRGRALFPNTPWGAMAALARDFNGDGAQDLFVMDMHSDMQENTTIAYDKLKSRPLWPDSTLLTGGISILGNAFYEAEEGAGEEDVRYTEISDANGSETYWPWGASAGDLNADGWEDILVAGGMGFTFRYAPNSLLLNEAGQGFVDAEFVVGLEPRPDGTYFRKWFVLDCDGRDAQHPLCEGQTGILQLWEPHSSRGSVLVDLEGDGDLDVVTGEWNAPPMVLTSDLAQLGELNTITIDLEGTTANRDGLGAVVRVVAGGREQVRVHDGQSGYLAQSDQPLYFGLGDASTVERIEVTWPGGGTQIVDGPFEAGMRVDIVQ